MRNGCLSTPSCLSLNLLGLMMSPFVPIASNEASLLSDLPVDSPAFKHTGWSQGLVLLQMDLINGFVL